MNIKEALAERFLLRIKPDKKLIDKELKEADYDLSKAEKALREDDYKWAIVKSYYAMFHTARAVLFNLGFREKKHFAVGVVLEELNKKGRLESRFINDFSAALQSREDADYHYIYSKEIAGNNLNIADEFTHKMRGLLNNSSKIGLFIGRFQPFHKAHLLDIKLALKECNKIIIAIGSSQESATKDNPFSYEERKDMIEAALKAHKILNYDIIPVPDINNDREWVDHVKKLIPEFDIVYTGNDFTEELFKEKNIKLKKIKLIPDISATEIRKRILKGNDWKELVPKEVADYIEKIDGIERIKEINQKPS